MTSDRKAIWLQLCLDDLERPIGAQATAELEDTEFDVELGVDLVPLGPERFRVPGPTSLTPFEPYGPMLNLGDVIQAVPVPDDCHRFVRRLETASIWTRIFCLPHISRILNGDSERLGFDPQASRHLFHEGRVGQILEKIERAGGGWEFIVANLTLQLPLEDDDAELPAHLQDLVDELLDHLLPLEARVSPRWLGQLRRNVGYASIWQIIITNWRGIIMDRHRF